MDDVLVLAPGFDFLGYGYHFRSRVFEQAEATIDRFVGQATRFYEQGRRELVNLPCSGDMFGGALAGQRAGFSRDDIVLPLIVPSGSS
jgi:hypothetical protein